MKIVKYIQNSALETKPFNCFGLVLFSYGCNLECKMCKGYNYEQVTNENNIIGNSIDIIKEKTTIIDDAVVFLGGEPTIWRKELIKSLKFCKIRGLKTKIFTNGVLHEVVEEINENGFCDAWSVDYKCFSRDAYSFLGIEGKIYFESLNKTLKNIIASKLPLEIRTTIFDGNEYCKDELITYGRNIIEGAKKINPDIYYRHIIQEDFRKNLI